MLVVSKMIADEAICAEDTRRPQAAMKGSFFIDGWIDLDFDNWLRAVEQPTLYAAEHCASS